MHIPVRVVNCSNARSKIDPPSSRSASLSVYFNTNLVGTLSRPTSGHAHHTHARHPDGHTAGRSVRCGYGVHYRGRQAAGR